MDMRHLIAAALSAFGLAAVAALPEISNVTMTRGLRGSYVITYDLSADAVVTLDICTNGVSIGEAKVYALDADGACTVTGDANVKVLAGKSRRIVWNARASLPADTTFHDAKAKLSAYPLDDTPDYLVVDIGTNFVGEAADRIRYYASSNALPGGLFGHDAYRLSKIVMRKIIAKDVQWTMGSIYTEPQYTSGREDAHPACLTNNFYIAVFELTQSQYGNVMKTVPSQKCPGAMRPVEINGNSYYTIRDSGTANANEKTYRWPKGPKSNTFMDKIRKVTGYAVDFDFPGEGQWEFACRAGLGLGVWPDGSLMQNLTPDTSLIKFARCKSNAYTKNEDSTVTTNGAAVVGSYLPNGWGLYDMLGNVMEWCIDFYADDYTKWNGLIETAYQGTMGNVARGGDWQELDAYCRPGQRGFHRYNLSGTTPIGHCGIRLVCRAGLK